MNVTFGLLPPLEMRVKKSERKLKLAERALASLEKFANELELR